MEVFCMFYVHDYLSHFMHMLVYMAHACRSDHLMSRGIRRCISVIVVYVLVYVLVYAGELVFRIVTFSIFTLQFVCRLASAESKSNLAASLARRNFLFLFGKFERFLQGLKSKFFLT